MTHVSLDSQADVLRFRQKMAPLPLEDAQRLHQELLMQAANKSWAWPVLSPSAGQSSDHHQVSGL